VCLPPFHPGQVIRIAYDTESVTSAQFPPSHARKRLPVPSSLVIGAVAVGLGLLVVAGISMAFPAFDRLL
jgi:hypothetical protein